MFGLMRSFNRLFQNLSVQPLRQVTPVMPALSRLNRQERPFHFVSMDSSLDRQHPQFLISLIRSLEEFRTDLIGDVNDLFIRAAEKSTFDDVELLSLLREKHAKSAHGILTSKTIKNAISMIKCHISKNSKLAKDVSSNQERKALRSINTSLKALLKDLKSTENEHSVKPYTPHFRGFQEKIAKEATHSSKQKEQNAKEKVDLNRFCPP